MGKIIFCSDLVVRVSDSQLIEMASHDADGLELTDDEGYPGLTTNTIFCLFSIFSNPEETYL